MLSLFICFVQNYCTGGKKTTKKCEEVPVFHVNSFEMQRCKILMEKQLFIFKSPSIFLKLLTMLQPATKYFIQLEIFISF